MDVHLSSQQQTVLLARHLADMVRQGDCLALQGEMGAGKSTFARALIRHMAGDEALEVPSPTFALVQPYETKAGTVFHYDLWRLSGPDELYELSWDDACESIMLVEWPDRAEDMLPAGALHLTFAQGTGEEARIVTLHGWPEERLKALSSFSEGRRG
ncbi:MULTISPECIES: tRNA (adenosine(37)-N6)-threonylcarbamoyltransferase complex ATPase subunit type 1 TsaE [Acetobacteraceae]|uniref:tRNA threonylcarbamoyladenosine biosynthesis protein TsaE n=1 Tax=Parasaccharibacter apium TaxID=1510841 RepID=A0A7U7G4I4_9PROT|nr:MULTISPECIES: tRNA (adenosine(37)-N6)-threonylcarbamoyltransferase complex ATPase subunit type 1 TsaE [Acetobacteraceae]MCL1562310.1 tRNA (adenosine(37)-N6)-threonylcarbamoyltransferase complex ATPase subunit type 1 TsaE [Parasaccharibacter sp. TMW 2.1886]MUG79996.1 tRNA (adenosine(37)-N6)-threonylcarbamoyltransferase complex ATPase subunit type 1 TsaE [Bombella sp. ESL0380]MCL1515553.1 tRNA (adenosine(37)-N6)-threonylcarbamoyltransferase complex ATPase subunit type 1 TsaE [Parasaccharibacter